MAYAYGAVCIISFVLLLICAIADKKHDKWLLSLFVSVFVCNTGYYFSSVSFSLEMALAANRISYLGSVFLPLCMFMMISKLCNKVYKKSIVAMLISISSIMFLIAASPGILPIYYKSVSFEMVNGHGMLMREYGPLHSVYYVYLFAYFAAMLVVIIRASDQVKIKSSLNAVFMAVAVLINIVIWLMEQFLPGGFEYLSVSYILSEIFIWIIYFVMQDSKRRLSLWTVAVIAVLLMLSPVRILAKISGPVLASVAEVVIYVCYSGLVLVWMASVRNRVMNKAVKKYLLIIGFGVLFWILMRTLRHTVFLYIYPFGMWCWYCYYIPMVIIPLLCFFIALHFNKDEEWKPSPLYRLLYIPAAVLISLILTNDIHELAFTFFEGYEAGWDVYRHNVIYYLTLVWIVAMLSTMLINLMQKSRTTAKKHIAVPVSIVFAGMVYTVLYIINSSVFGFIEMTVALCGALIGILESCIYLGLINSNTNYEGFFNQSDIAAQIVDNNYRVHYSAHNAMKLSKEIMQKAENTYMLDENIRLKSCKIAGGHVIWQEDIAIINKLLYELQELNEMITEDNKLVEAENESKRKISKLKEKNKIYDEALRTVNVQLEKISRYLSDMSKTELQLQMLVCVCVLGAYIKRRINLFLISYGEAEISTKELSYSIKESLDYIKLAGADSIFTDNLEGSILSSHACLIYDVFECAVEASYPGISAIIVNAESFDDKTVVKLVFENAKNGIEDRELIQRVKNSGGSLELTTEDECRYVRITLPKGGEA